MNVDTWLNQLPPALHKQQALLRRLLAAVEADARWQWLQLACSVAEGRGDSWSDLDMGLGIDEDAWPQALKQFSDSLW